MDWGLPSLSNIYKYVISRGSLIISLALLGALCFFVPALYIPGLLLVLSAYIVTLKKGLGADTATSTFIAVLLFFSVNALGCFILWAIHIHFLGAGAGIVNLLALSVLPSGKRISLDLPVLAGSLILISVLVTFVALASPYLRDRSPATITQLVLQGEDNISHIELTKNVLRNNGLAFTDTAVQETHLNKNLAGYPEAVHANLALVIRSLQNLHMVKTAYRFLVVYYLLTCAIYSLLVGSMVLLTIYLLRQINKKVLGLVQILGLAVAIGGLSSTLFLGLFSAGFLTYLVTPGLLLMTVLFLLQTSKEKDLSNRRFLVLLAALFCAAMQFSWLFLLPFIVPAFIISLVVIELNGEYRFISLARVKDILLAHFYALAIVFVSCLQLLVQAKTTAVKIGVNDPGYIYTIHLSYMLGIIGGAGLVLLLLNLRRKIWTQVYLLILSLNVLFSAAIYLYQKITVHELRYYFFKSEYSILFLALPLIIAGIVVLVGFGQKQAEQANGRHAKWVFSLILVVIAGFVSKEFIRPNVDAFWPYRWSAASQPALNKVILAYKNPSPVNYIVMGQCLRADDYKLSRLSTVLAQNTNSDIRTIYSNLLLDPRDSKAAIYSELEALPKAETKNVEVIDIGNTLKDAGSINQINLPAETYSAACVPLL